MSFAVITSELFISQNKNTICLIFTLTVLLKAKSLKL